MQPTNAILLVIGSENSVRGNSERSPNPRNWHPVHLHAVRLVQIPARGRRAARDGAFWVVLKNDRQALHFANVWRALEGFVRPCAESSLSRYKVIRSNPIARGSPP